MSRKDYEAIAVAICRAKEELAKRTESSSAKFWADETFAAVVDNIAHVFALDNKLFDRARFVEACTL